jgi:dTDP-4-dehydrorhamnose 3,5-epimerase
MRVNRTKLEGCLVIEPKRFGDARGFFLESYHQTRYREEGITDSFVQDNHSRSMKNILRGMHFTVRKPQAQIVTVMRGHIFDVGVDLRSGSATFGQWVGAELRDDAACQIYMPPGLAHGFCVLSEFADLHYKCSEMYDAEDEGGLLWSDPDIGIAWPLLTPAISSRDTAFPRLRDIPSSKLPAFQA